jgi:hypothetical protein
VGYRLQKPESGSNADGDDKFICKINAGASHLKPVLWKARLKHCRYGGERYKTANSTRKEWVLGEQIEAISGKFRSFRGVLPILVLACEDDM